MFKANLSGLKILRPIQSVGGCSQTKFQKKLIQFMETNKLAAGSHSGDDIRLIESGERRIVTKTSTAQKQKLIESATLQENFAPFCQRVRAVPLLSKEMNGQLARVTMPFIQGHTGAELYLNVSPSVLKNISLSLISNVNRSFYAGLHISVQDFKRLSSEKVEMITKTLTANTKNQFFLGEKLIQETIANVNDRIARIQLGCPLGQLHGDLTFSNIIYNKNTTTIWLIDFLTSFIQTPLIDVAKLIQEFKYQWSARHMPSNQLLPAKIVGEKLMNMLFQNIDAKLWPIIGILSIINLYRIAPYVKDSITHDWLLGAIAEELECKY